MAVATHITTPLAPGTLRQVHSAPDSVMPTIAQHEIQKKAAHARKKKRQKFLVARKVKSSERMLLLDNLSTMLAAGLGITDALSILTEEMKNKMLRNALRDIAHSIEIGKTFSEGLQAYPHVFPPLLTSTIRVGEMSGTLVEVLARLAEMARRESELKRKVIGALMYPSVVVLAMIVVAIIMLTYVFPQLISVFEESNIKLPLQIVIINAVGNIIRDYGSLILGGIIALFLLIYFLLKIRKVRKAFDRAILKFPLFGTQLIKGSILARLALNLRTLLKSGLPIVEGIKVIAETIKNLEYRDALMEIANEVEIGHSIHESMGTRGHLFTPIIVRMVTVGEGTGKLDDILQKVGIYYEGKVDQILTNLSTIIEPVLLLAVGVVVGFIAVSIIGPIYEIANNI